MVLQLIMNGLAMGSIYSLVALGITVIASSVGVVNFAQGDFVMIAAYIFFTAATILKAPMLVAFIVALVFMLLFGAVFQRVAYYPLRNAKMVAVMVSTFGVSVFLKNGAILAWGPEPQFMSSVFGSTVLNMAGITINPQHLLIFGVTALLLVMQYFIFERTTLGKQMRATSQDKETATLIGIRVDKIILITFMYSTGLAAIAGILLAPIFFVSSEMGGMVSQKAMSACVLGGFGSIPGAIIGGLLIGLIEIFGAAYVSSLYKDIFPFAVLVAVLLLRPRGIFGEKVSEKV